MVVQGFQSSLHILLGPVGCILVVLHDAHGGEHPSTAGWENLVIPYTSIGQPEPPM